MMNYSMSREPNDFEIKIALKDINKYAQTSQAWATYREKLTNLYRFFEIKIVRTHKKRAQPYRGEGEEYNPYLISL